MPLFRSTVRESFKKKKKKPPDGVWAFMVWVFGFSFPVVSIERAYLGNRLQEVDANAVDSLLTVISRNQGTNPK